MFLSLYHFLKKVAPFKTMWGTAAFRCWLIDGGQIYSPSNIKPPFILNLITFTCNSPCGLYSVLISPKTKQNKTKKKQNNTKKKNKKQKTKKKHTQKKPKTNKNVK